MDVDFTKAKDFFVGIDSDGCAFDTMELKHKECFIPNIIHYWGLKGVSKYARETAEFVNLYSKSRGVNRFPAIYEVLQLLNKRPEVIERIGKIEIPQILVDWIKSESKLGNPALIEYVAHTDSPIMRRVLEWSVEINKTIDRIVGDGVPPFPKVRESLKKLSERADISVVSQTPHAALEKEWTKQGLARYVRAICGQEVGTKAECLAFSRNYEKAHSLMIGDAPGDLKAAVANDALFYPIVPGKEEASWERFYAEGIDKFLNCEFSGEYQRELLEEFDRSLPQDPSWRQIS